MQFSHYKGDLASQCLILDWKTAVHSLLTDAVETGASSQSRCPHSCEGKGPECFLGWFKSVQEEF